MSLKVLQFGRHFPPHIGGTETVIFDLADGLSNMGVKCDVLCCNDHNLYKEDNFGKFNVYRTSSIANFASTAISPQLISKLRELAPTYDIIHIHHPSPMATLALRLVNPKTKVVLSWHSDIVKQKNLLKIYKPLQDWLIKKADVIVATTPVYIQGSSSLRKYPDKTTFIPLGIQKVPAADSQVLARIKARFRNKKIVFSLGRLVEYKGFEDLVRAGKYLIDDVVIVIGGSGHLQSSLESIIAAESLSQKVFLVGRVPDEEIPAYYEACDIFCLSSVTKNEAFGLVLIEAMSKGKPIIATKIPDSGVSWVNDHGFSGLNVPVNDPLELANAINMIISDSKVATTFSMNALKRFEQHFTKMQMVESYFNLYTKILSQ